MADLPSNYAGTVRVTVRGRDYYVHMTAPMPMMSLEDMEKALQNNRNMIKKSQDELREAFVMEAFKYAAPWQLNYDGPTQNAIQAHININMLVPLINMKGGSASFEKPETLNVQTRLETMRTVAEKSVFMERHLDRPNTVNTAFAVTAILLLLLSLSLI